MTALPSPLEVERILCRASSSTFDVYAHVVLPAERDASKSGNKDSDDANIVAARVVGYLLLYPPSEDARRAILSELRSCKDAPDAPSQAVYALGMMYIRSLLLIFKKPREGTPIPSGDASSGLDCVQKLSESIGICLKTPESAPRDHATAKACALVRDNYRCMVTGKVDGESIDSGHTQCSAQEMYTVTRCCYIFPESLGDDTGPSGDSMLAEEGEPMAFWELLDRFGFKDVREELGSTSSGAANVHRLENVMTLDAVVQDLFDDMNIWFEAVDGEPHCYDVVRSPTLARRGGRDPLPQRVQFAAHHHGLPLPNPRYLHLHAACCRIAHLSGAAEYLDRLSRELEEMKTLASDGASAEGLSFALDRHLARTA